MGQRTEQRVQNEETLSGTRKVLIFDEDVELTISIILLAIRQESLSEHVRGSKMKNRS